MSLIDPFWRIFFGRDVFVSYSRKDADAYAMALANTLMGGKPRLSCYLDTYAAPPGSDLPASLKRNLRCAGMLVLVGTEGSVISDNVRKEVEIFASTRRKVLPIDCGGFDRLDWTSEPWVKISGAARLREPPARTEPCDEPSPNVADAIRRSVGFTRQERRLQWMVAGALVVILLSITGSMFFVRRAAAARRETQRQQQIALARSRASNSDVLRRRQPMAITTSVLLAVEAVGRFQELAMPATDADMALRDSMALVPPLVTSTPAAVGKTIVAVSNDAPYFATANGGVANVWSQLDAGRPVCTIRHDSPIHAIAFGGRGRYLATGGEDKVLRVSSAATGDKLFEIAHAATIVAIVFDPSGSRVASADADGVISVAAVPDGNRLARVRVLDELLGFSFDGEGKRLIAMDEYGAAQVWDTATGAEVGAKGEEPSNVQIKIVKASRSREVLAAATRDGLIRLLDTSTAGVMTTIDFGERFRSGYRFLFDVAISSDGRMVATVTSDDQVRLWINEQGLAKQFDQFNLALSPWNVAFSPDASLLATRSEGGPLDHQSLIQLWEVRTGEEVGRIAVAEDDDWMVFSSDSRRLLTAGGKDQPVRVWSLTNSPLLAPVVFPVTLDAAVYTPDRKSVVATGQADVQVRDVHTGALKATLPHNQQIQAADFSPDGRFIATAAGRYLQIWSDWQSGRPKPQAPIDIWIDGLAMLIPVGRLTFSPKGTYLAVSYRETQRVRLFTQWQTRPTEIASVSFPCIPWDITFTPDEMFLTAGCDQALKGTTARHGVWIVSVRQPAAARKILGFEVQDVAVSKSGRYLITRSDDTVRAWDSWQSTPRPVMTLRHEGVVTSFDLSDDESLLATGGGERSAQVWTFPVGDELARISHGSGVVTVALTPDRRHVLTMSVDGKARVWLWRPNDLIAEACRRVRRDLTAAEWKNYLPSEPPRSTCSAVAR